MDWTHVLGIVLGNAAWTLPMFFWNRAEARADARKQDQETKELRRELIGVMRELKEDGRIFREQWAQESKDFHGRLCSIEEKRIK